MKEGCGEKFSPGALDRAAMKTDKKGSNSGSDHDHTTIILGRATKMKGKVDGIYCFGAEAGVCVEGAGAIVCCF